MSERHSLAWAGDVSPAVGTCASSMGMVLFSLVAALMVLPVSARQITIPTQPLSPYADTEVSTNVVLQTGRSDVREVKLHLQLEGTPTNDLEVAFGRDANANGLLDLEEVETVYGWRGGRYFIENARTWERIETEAADNAQPGGADIHLTHGPDFAPKSFTARCGGETAFAALSTTPPPPWLFRNNWNMARAVRRGVGTPGEWVRLAIGYNSFVINLR